MLWFMGPQRVGHDRATELNWPVTYNIVFTIHVYLWQHTISQSLLKFISIESVMFSNDLSHCAINLKLTQYCKSTVFQLESKQRKQRHDPCPIRYRLHLLFLSQVPECWGFSLTGAWSEGTVFRDPGQLHPCQHGGSAAACLQLALSCLQFKWIQFKWMENDF